MGDTARRAPVPVQDLDLLAYRALRQQRTAPAEQWDSLQCYDQTKSIFVHVPKTAGISISQALYGHGRANHMTVGWYQLMFDRETFSRYFKFGFVRNPWDRAVSAFRFLRAGGFTDHDKHMAETFYAGFADFDDFVKRWLSSQDLNDRRSGLNEVFVPQYRYFCLPGTSSPLVDFIGFYENIADDFAHVSKRLGIACSLPHKNASNRSSKVYTDYYTDESREIISRLYRTDIEMFGYDFEGANLGEQIRKRGSTTAGTDDTL